MAAMQRAAMPLAATLPIIHNSRRLRIPSAAFAGSRVSGTQEDLIPGCRFLAPERG
jgi:hypothetical protein